MGNTQQNHAGTDDSGGGAFACIGSGSEKKAIKKGMRPKLAFERIDKNAKNTNGGGLCAAPRESCVGVAGNKSEKAQKAAKLSQEEWALKKEELKRRMRSNLSLGQTRDQNSFTPSKNDNVYFDEPCQCKGICVCRYKKAAMMTSDAKAAQSNFEERIKNLKKQIAKEKYREKMEHARRAGVSTKGTRNYIDI